MSAAVRLLGGTGVQLTYRVPVEVVSSLTAAELEVARMLADSFSNADIARTRGTALNTAANQVAALYRKLRVRCRRECVLRLYGGSLVPIDGSRLSAMRRLVAR